MSNSKSITHRSKKFKTDRNRKLYELYSNPQNRLSYPALARMFQISQSRVWQIIKDWKEHPEVLKEGGEKS